MDNENDYNNKFDDFFRDKLNEVPNFPNQKENWQKVSNVLHTQPIHKAHASLRSYWWVVPMLFLLGWNGCQMQMLQQIKTNNMVLHEDNILLKKSMQQLQTQLVATHDTIRKSHTILIQDTIYRRVYVFEKINANPAYYAEKDTFSTVLGHSNKDFSINNTSKTSHITNVSPNVKPITKDTSEQFLQNNSIQPKDTTYKSVATTITDTLAQKTVHLQDSTQTQPLPTTADEADTPIAPKNIPIKKPTFREISMGLQAGFSDLMPHTPQIYSAQWLGGSAEWAMHPNFRLVGTVDRSDFHFKILEMPKNTEPLNLPAQPAMLNDAFKLGYIESNVTSWNVGLEANYQLLPNAKVRPFLSAGYMYHRVLPHEIEFEFKNMAINAEKGIKVMSASHTDQWWQLGGGVETKLTNDLKVKLSATTIYDNNHGINSLNYWLVRLGVFYQIK
jgi:opacity protein-like surface antigen